MEKKKKKEKRAKGFIAKRFFFPSSDSWKNCFSEQCCSRHLYAQSVLETIN